MSYADDLEITLSPEGNGFEIKSREQNLGVILYIESLETSTRRELRVTF